MTAVDITVGDRVAEADDHGVNLIMLFKPGFVKRPDLGYRKALRSHAD